MKPLDSTCTYRAMVDERILAKHVEVAHSFLKRAVGLLGRGGLETDTLMWIHPAATIHTLGMQFPIDVVFLNRQNQIVKVVSAVPPGRAVMGGFGAYSVLEAAAGWLDVDAIQPGAQVTFLLDEAAAVL